MLSPELGASCSCCMVLDSAEQRCYHPASIPAHAAGAQNKIKNLADKAKAYVNNVSELELKVLEATNHDPWGPHGSVMQGGCRLISASKVLRPALSVSTAMQL